ncbi:MAG: hypothetical protein ABEI76_07575 [Halobacteriales archaeon]
MAQSLQAAVVEAVRDAIPFLAITVVWIVIMLVIYGVFLVTKPTNVSYDAWVYASVFAVPGVGFLGHILHQALKGGQAV